MRAAKGYLHSGHTYWIVEEGDGAHKEFFSPIKHRFYWPLINYPPP